MSLNNAPSFIVDAAVEGDGVRLKVTRNDGASQQYLVPGSDPTDYAAFFDALHRDFGTLRPHRPDPVPQGPEPPWTPLLTDNVHPQILSGYGDPAVIRTAEGWWLLATSNDAPDAFPILFSDDLRHWHSHGFVFPAGGTANWTSAGRGVGDFWAPEVCRVHGEYWLVYTARDSDRSLSIGLARAPHPAGPWVDNGTPLISGSVIDSHIHVDETGAPWLLWKKDSNSHWPRPLAALLGAHPHLIPLLFQEDSQRASAAFCAAIQPFAETRRPMERFFLMQPLIRAALANWSHVRAILTDCGLAESILPHFTTPIFGQRLAPDGRGLVGERHTLLVNDFAWEGHLVEGPFLWRHDGRYFLFYAGNDFTSSSYGIGYAVADRLTGPYRKAEEPLLRSHANWSAPGHASVSTGADGAPRLFFHAFHPGTGGYNAFRALLTVGLTFDGETVRLSP